MKKIFLLSSLILLIISCTKEVDSPALLNQVSSLQSQVATLQSQVAAGSTLQTQLNTKSAELTAAVANYNASQASLAESQAAYATLEEAYTDLSLAYNEITDTVSLWFENAQGVYQFYTTINGVRTGADYLWDLGVTFPGGDSSVYGIPYFNEYYGNGGTCYTLSEDSSLGPDAEVYISEASFNDLGIIAYDLDASSFSIFDINLNYNKVNQAISITNFSAGIYFKIYWYDTDFNLIGTLGNYANSSPNAPLTSAQITALVVCD